MDLKQVSQVLLGLETMTSRVYDLKEAILEKKDTSEGISEYKREILHLWKTLISSLSEDDLKEVMEERTRINKGKLLKYVSECAGVSVSRLLSTKKKRDRELVLPRQVHMVMLNVAFKDTLAKAGSIYNKDHATVLHAKNKPVKNLFDTDKYFREKYAKVFDFCYSIEPVLTKDYLGDEFKSE